MVESRRVRVLNPPIPGSKNLISINTTERSSGWQRNYNGHVIHVYIMGSGFSWFPCGAWKLPTTASQSIVATAEGAIYIKNNGCHLWIGCHEIGKFHEKSPWASVPCFNQNCLKGSLEKNGHCCFNVGIQSFLFQPYILGSSLFLK
jgi:hypothetical protein